MIDYWINVIQELNKPITIEARLYTQFWPKSQGYQELPNMDGQFDPEKFLGYEE